MNVAEELERLQQLRDSGAIDEDEFATAKSKVLNPTSNNLFGIPANSTPLTAEAQESKTRQWAMLLHLSMLLVNVIIPGGGLVAPIIIWQMMKDKLPGLNVHGINATNWIISSTIYAVVSGVLLFLLIGFPLLIAVIICGIAFPIIAAVKASNGEVWKYPCSIEFIKE